tara:strand:+ start:2500 stop:3273 length:774 start_codon:yes stop_codon:yes gene_type:complete
MSPVSQEELSQIRAQALISAGPKAALRRRARGYLDLFDASNGACMFALVAAHGALWASWYLAAAKLVAAGLAAVDPTGRPAPVKRYRELSAYVTALKDINQLVMVETYVLIHTIKEFGPEAAIAQGIPADLARDYATAMASPQTPAFLRDLFHRHFLWEQERVVSDKLDDAFGAITWPLMRSLCQRPWVWFAYFRVGASMNFRSFTDQAERIEKGLIAYDRAIDFGPQRLARITHVRLRIYPGFKPMRWRSVAEPMV